MLIQHLLNVHVINEMLHVLFLVLSIWGLLHILHLQHIPILEYIVTRASSYCLAP